jgi:hypothetical protein
LLLLPYLRHVTSVDNAQSGPSYLNEVEATHKNLSANFLDDDTCSFDDGYDVGELQWTGDLDGTDLRTAIVDFQQPFSNFIAQRTHHDLRQADCQEDDIVYNVFPWIPDSESSNLVQKSWLSSPSPTSTFNHSTHGQDYLSLRDVELYNLAPDNHTSEPLLFNNMDGRIDNTNLDLTTYDPVALDQDPAAKTSQPTTAYAGNIRSISTKKGHHPRGKISVLKEWLHKNGLTAYPDSKQMQELADAEGKTLKQAQVALSNHRARLRQSKPSKY